MVFFVCFAFLFPFNCSLEFGEFFFSCGFCESLLLLGEHIFFASFLILKLKKKKIKELQILKLIFSHIVRNQKKKKKIETSHYFSFLSFLTKQKMGYNLFEIWFNQRSFLKMETKMKLKRLHSLFVLKTVQRTLRLTLRLGFLTR